MANWIPEAHPAADAQDQAMASTAKKNAPRTRSKKINAPPPRSRETNWIPRAWSSGEGRARARGTLCNNYLKLKRGGGGKPPLPPNPPPPLKPSQFKGRPVYLPSPPAESPEFATLSVAKPDPRRTRPLFLTVSFSGTDTAKPSPNHFFQGDHVYGRSAHETHCHGIFI